MPLRLVCLLLLALAGSSRAEVAAWLSAGFRRLQREEAELSRSLAELPPEPGRHTTERLGFHSGYSSSPDTVEWIELDLREEQPIDAVVLIAAPSSSGGAGDAGYGFPVRFRVELTEGGIARERFILADFTRKDFPNPGMLPVELPAQGRQVRRIRITATKLYREDHRYLFALGEVMILRGERNVSIGLGREDFTESRTMGAVPVWGLANLVDGHTALGLPVGPQPSPTLGYQSKLANTRKEPVVAPRWVQVDLGQELPIDEVRLFPAHPPEFAHRQGFGFPVRAKLELADEPEFQNPRFVAGFDDGDRTRNLPVSPGDNVVTYPGHGQRARYVRFTALELHNANGQFNLALAELQVWSGGKNVARDVPVAAFDSMENKGWSKAALVDGFTSEARIVGWPEWLGGLSRRREVLQALNEVHLQQAQAVARLQRGAWLSLAGVVAAGGVGLGWWLLRQRQRRRRELEALRLRIAQDLHDEIGSSLGSISLISQEVMAGGGSAQEVRNELKEIQEIARQTVDAMRDIVRLVQSERYGGPDFTAHLRETAARSLRTIPHTLHAEAGEAFNRLPMDAQRDLMLMFKEALHNIVRHAGATQVEIELNQRAGQLVLVTQDNGRGFDLEALAGDGMGLVNLRRRAAKLGGELSITSSPASSTRLVITLPEP